jgi:hypothetical protein
MSVLRDQELERLLATLHARSDEQVAAMEIYHAERTKKAQPPTEAEVKAFRSDKLVALDRDKAEFCYQLCRATSTRTHRLLIRRFLKRRCLTRFFVQTNGTAWLL